jgi:hypothetical protein
MFMIIYVAVARQDIWIDISHIWDEALQSLDFFIEDIVK